MAAQAAADDGVVDLVPTFAFPIPFLVICELLGLPDEDRETFRQLGSARFDVSYGGQGVVRRGVGLAPVPDGGAPPSSAATRARG